MAIYRGKIKGEKGDSAYQSAIKQGFQGTEQEWLLTLKGEKGDPGTGGAEWGGITGTLASQTDLKSELDLKSGTGHNHDLSGLREKSYESLTDRPTLHNHSNKTALDNVSGVNTGDQNLSGKVDKETGKSLVQDTEIVKIHEHSNKAILDLIQEALTTVLKTNYDTGYNHSQSSHSPANAQKNSDILKSEIEAVLTGVINSHSHSGGGGLGYAINVQALTSSPSDGATVYFGMLPKAPTTTANISKIYIRKAGTIKIVEIYCYSGTAGTAEAWSLYIRKNNSADTLIKTLSVATNERVFTNAGLNIPVVEGDYIEIKSIQPTWATNPATTIYGGYIYVE